MGDNLNFEVMTVLCQAVRDVNQTQEATILIRLVPIQIAVLAP